jgi:serine/threonine protein kinase
MDNEVNENISNNPPPISKDEPKIIGQGTYGCVISPSIDIQGNVDPVSGYITKIELGKSTTANEVNIGNKIKEIPDYEEMFSPIIENDEVLLSKINTKEIGECNIIKSLEKDTTLEMNKIKYVGKDSLGMYLMNILKEYPAKWFEVAIDTHLTLLDSFTELNKIGIIHNDVKENNILCRNEDGRPIIIDFGLSMEKEYLILPTPSSILGSLTTEKKSSHIHKYFFKYAPDYEVWCIDIHILNYMMTVLNKEWLESMVTQEQVNLLSSLIKEEAQRFSEFVNTPWSQTILTLKTIGKDNLIEVIYENYGYQWRTRNPEGIIAIIDSYIENNLMASQLFSKEDVENYKTRMVEYIDSYKDKTWETVFNDLISYQETWDNYALSFMYMKIIKSLEISGNEKIDEYVLLLKNIILSGPNERKTPDKTKELIIEVLKKVPKTVYRRMMEMFFGSKENHSELSRNIATEQIEEIKSEAQLYEAKKL